MSDDAYEGGSDHEQEVKFTADILYQIDFPPHPTHGYRPWYTSKPFTRGSSFTVGDDIILGIAFRPLYTTIEGSEDYDDFVENVESVAFHVEWFPSGITGGELIDYSDTDTERGGDAGDE